MHRIQQQFCALFLIGIGALGAWPANTLAGQTLDARYDRFMVVHEQTRGQSTAERAMAMSVAFDDHGEIVPMRGVTKNSSPLT